jgi:hypothetical protein
MFLEIFFVATMIQNHSCKFMKLPYCLRIYKYLKNGLQTHINKLTIIVLVNGLSKL